MYSNTLEYLLREFEPILSRRGVEDVCLNEPNIAWVWERGKFHRVDVAFAARDIEDLAIVAAARRKQDVSEHDPLLGIEISDRLRLQIVLPPCTRMGAPLMVMRQGSEMLPTLAKLDEYGYFRETKPLANGPSVADLELLDLYKAGEWCGFMQGCAELRKTRVICGTMGSGKAQPDHALVLTPTGFRNIGSLSVGDLVTAPDGKATAITGIYPQGEKDIYRITFHDGRSVECCDDHLWKVWFRNLRTRAQQAAREPSVGWHVVQTSTVRQWLSSANHQAVTLIAVPLVEPFVIEMPPQDLPIPPYALGALLGDGHLSKRVDLSVAEPHILERVLSDLPDYEAVPTCGVDYRLRLAVTRGTGHPSRAAMTFAHVAPPVRRPGARAHRITFGGVTDSVEGWSRRTDIPSHNIRNRLFRWHWPVDQALGFTPKSPGRQTRSPIILMLEDMGLSETRSHQKFVPDLYKKGSVAQRIALLQGLLDTDGSVGNGTHATFTSTSEQLARDVQELAWSLGAIAKIASRQTHYKYAGERKPGRPSWRVSIVHPDIAQFFSLPRKVAQCKLKTMEHRLRITGIELIGRKPARCIAIDHPSRLYVTNDYVVTHNTHLGKAWIDAIPKHVRLGLMADTDEHAAIAHPNKVDLFWGKSGVRALQIAEAALRMRIGVPVLGEIRTGDAALAFISLLLSGHSGGVTTLHAPNCRAAKRTLRMRIKQTDDGRALSDPDINEMLDDLIDVIVHCERHDDPKTGETKYFMDDIWFKAAEKVDV